MHARDYINHLPWFHLWAIICVLKWDSSLNTAKAAKVLYNRESFGLLWAVGWRQGHHRKQQHGKHPRTLQKGLHGSHCFVACLRHIADKCWKQQFDEAKFGIPGSPGHFFHPCFAEPTNWCDTCVCMHMVCAVCRVNPERI